MESSNRLSRRQFLRVAGASVTGALVLAACAVPGGALATGG